MADGTVLSPCSAETSVDLDQMTLSDFKLWSEKVLKAYLFIRRKNVEGTFEELAARAFISWEDKAAVDPNEEHLLRKNLEENKTRLVFQGSTLPDPFTLKKGWLTEEGRTNWPSVYFCDIADYMKMTTPKELYHRLCNEYKQGKAFRYFTSGLLKEVHYHPINDTSDVAFIAAKIGASMRLSSPPHEAWVCIKKDQMNEPGGEIISAYCTCTAGLKGCCNHVAAVLFRVEYAVRTGLTKPSATSQRCVWNVPGGFKPSAPIKLCEQVWKKDQYFKTDDTDRSASVRNLTSTFSPMSRRQESYASSDRIKTDLASILREQAPDSCFVQLFDKLAFPSPPQPNCPRPPSVIATGLGHPVTVDMLVQEMTLNDTEVSNLQTVTVGQSSNQLWIDQRVGRVTASSFHRVFTRNKTLLKSQEADPSPLIKSIMGYETVPDTVAIKHGRSMEIHAKQAFAKLLSKHHRKFKTEECGLFVMKEHTFIGASPDLITICDCNDIKCSGGKAICEIKCPESIKDKCPTSTNYKHLVTEEGSTVLSRSSPYYTQIQGQMGVTGVNKCFFFVYTPKGHHIETITFNSGFWEDVLSHLDQFWKKYIAPELIYGHLSISTDNSHHDSADHTYYASQVGQLMNTNSAEATHALAPKGPLTRPKLPYVYMCGKCGDDLADEPQHDEDQSTECSKCHMWYHTLCVKVKDIASVGQSDWYCYNCI